MTGTDVGQVEHNSATPSSVPAKPKTIGVYAITCSASGKSYIGWSLTVRDRLSNHKSLLRSGKHQRREMQEDFNLHGEASFTFSVLCHCQSGDEAMKEEAIRIGEAFKSGKTYNAMIPTPQEDAWTKRLATKQRRDADTLRRIEDEKRLQQHQATEKIRREESLRVQSIVDDVMWYLNYRDDEQFLRLIDAFVALSGITEETLSLEVTGYPKFLFALRQPASQGCSLRNGKKFHDYILNYMEERDRKNFAEMRAARELAKQAAKVAA